MGVALQLDADDRDVTVADSEFSRCQHGLACILAQGRGLTVDDVRFHTVRDADVIRGAADDVTISDSDLHDALPGTHYDNHNDLIQILGGGPLDDRAEPLRRARQRRRPDLRRPAPWAARPRARPAHRVERLHRHEQRHVLRDPAADAGRVGDDAADRRRDRQQHDHLGECGRDRAGRRVREDPRRAAPARREQRARPPEARPLHARAHAHERRREGRHVQRRPQRRCAPRRRRQADCRIQGAARGRHRRRRPGDGRGRCRSGRLRLRSAPTSCPADGTARTRSSSVLAHGDLQRRPHAHARRDVHDRARLDGRRGRRLGRDPARLGTSAAARAPRTTATANRSRPPVPSSTAPATPSATTRSRSRRSRRGCARAAARSSAAAPSSARCTISPASSPGCRRGGSWASPSARRRRRSRSASTRSRARPTARGARRPRATGGSRSSSAAPPTSSASRRSGPSATSRCASTPTRAGISPRRVSSCRCSAGSASS